MWVGSQTDALILLRWGVKCSRVTAATRLGGLGDVVVDQLREGLDRCLVVEGGSGRWLSTPATRRRSPALWAFRSDPLANR